MLRWVSSELLSGSELVGLMLAACATSQHPDAPLQGLELRDVDPSSPPPGWSAVQLHAAALNHHDLWALRGFGLAAERLPMVLGSDGAGVTADGQEVIVHSVVRDQGVLSLLSERLPGTLAEWVIVPSANLVPKPAAISFDEAACLPTSYLTAYNMLFGKGRLSPGEHVLIQGAGGGVSTAAILLAVAAGLEVTVTSRDEQRARRALDLGAHHALTAGQRLPNRVDAVLETVGAATFGHSLRAVRDGGRIIVAGATSGFDPPAELQQLFLRDITIMGTFMGDRTQLELLARFLATTGTRPLIDSVWPLRQTREAMQRLADGDAFGKLVIRPRDTAML